MRNNTKQLKYSEVQMKKAYERAEQNSKTRVAWNDRPENKVNAYMNVELSPEAVQQLKDHIKWKHGDNENVSKEIKNIYKNIELNYLLELSIKLDDEGELIINSLTFGNKKYNIEKQ